MNIKNYFWNRKQYIIIAFSKEGFKYGWKTYGLIFPLAFILALCCIPFLKSFK